MAGVIECINDMDYQAAINSSENDIVLVEFYAEWTTPSQVISYEIGLLRLSFPNVVYVRVNFDFCPVVFI